MNDKKQLAAMGEHLVEQQPLCMAKRIEELEAQLLVMAGLLREARVAISESMPFFNDRSDCYKVEEVRKLPSSIDAALSGKVPNPSVPEGWQLVSVEPTHDMLHVIIHCDNFDVVEPGMTGKYYRAMLAASPKPEAK